VTELALWDAERFGDVFSESDRLLVDAAIRLAERLGEAPVEVGTDLYAALLLVAKAIRHNHAAIPLDASEFAVIFEEQWTRVERDGRVSMVGTDENAEALRAALASADERLVGHMELSSPAVGAGGSPFVISTAGGEPRYCSTRRLTSAECEIALALISSASRLDDEHALPTLDRLLDGRDDLTPEVVEFFGRVLSRSITVLTGGPGTGKTTAIATLLMRLGAEARSSGGIRRIALCAPTAKAAVRMREAIDDALANEGESLASMADALAIDPNSGSVHRLLGIRPDDTATEAILDCDLVIVDEVSMLELPMLATLLRVASSSNVVLVGDPNQLVSVEVGAVLRDIVDAGGAGQPLDPIVTRLTHVHRSNAAIVELAAAINEGSLEKVHRALERHPGELALVADAEELVGDVVARAVEIHELADAGDVPGALTALGRLVVLGANREGDRSVAWWQKTVGDALRRRFPGQDNSVRFSVGTPIMVTRNESLSTREPTNRLSNGDVGVVVASNDGPKAFFLPASEAPRSRELRLIDQAVVAWAFTIHKSQGSEYDRVIVSLPTSVNRILSKELLYTAVTRARHEVAIVGSDAVLAAALGTTVVRTSGLAERIARLG
jgi:exodeoxyribonuclease V alpha subunit